MASGLRHHFVDQREKDGKDLKDEKKLGFSTEFHHVSDLSRTVWEYLELVTVKNRPGFILWQITESGKLPINEQSL